MNGLPNAQLMDLYGTDEHYLEKCGFISTGALKALQVIAPVLSLGLARSDSKHQEKLLAEAEMMNQMLRAAEADRMAPIHASFGSPGVAPGLGSDFTGVAKLSSATDISEDIGRQLALSGIEKTAEFYSAVDKLESGVAYYDLTEMEKEAFGGAAFGKALGFLGKQVGKAGKALGGTGGGGGLLGKAGGRMREAGVGMRQKGLQMRGVKPKPKAPTKPVNLVDGSMQQKGGPYRKPPTEVAPTSAATEAVGEAVEEGAKKKPWISGATKVKATIGLGAIGAGYVGLKGAQTARDYMMLPSHGGGRWGHGTPVPTGVNRYGYVSQRF